MDFIEWNEEFECGIESIDKQHKHLIEIINKFVKGLHKGTGNRQMTEILNDLIGYTQEHFRFEEKMIEGAGYEKFKQHQAQHRQLIQKIERFQYNYEVDGQRVTQDVKNFLQYWMSSHIMTNDKAFVSAVKKQKVSQES